MQNVSQASVYKLHFTIESKWAGHDGIHAKLLKDTAEEIVPSLTAILMLLLIQEYRSETKLICDNYRLSFLSCVAKIFDILITKQIEAYLESNGLL